MIDEPLPPRRNSSAYRDCAQGPGLNRAACGQHLRPCVPFCPRINRPLNASSLLDQSDLTDLAERLVTAARRAGADQADALAVRSVSLSVEVRDGAVEESQRSEGDDLGLRVHRRPQAGGRFDQ